MVGGITAPDDSAKAEALNRGPNGALWLQLRGSRQRTLEPVSCLEVKAHASAAAVAAGKLSIAEWLGNHLVEAAAVVAAARAQHPDW